MRSTGTLSSNQCERGQYFFNLTDVKHSCSAFSKARLAWIIPVLTSNKLLCLMNAVSIGNACPTVKTTGISSSDADLILLGKTSREVRALMSNASVS